MRDWDVVQLRRNHQSRSGKTEHYGYTDLQNKRCSIFHHFQVPADIIGTLEGIHVIRPGADYQAHRV